FGGPGRPPSPGIEAVRETPPCPAVPAPPVLAASAAAPSPPHGQACPGSAPLEVVPPGWGPAAGTDATRRPPGRPGLLAPRPPCDERRNDCCPGRPAVGPVAWGRSARQDANSP